MRLIIITHETLCKRDSWILNKLFDEGMETLHLRKPLATEAEVRQLLNQIDEKYHHRIVLHDHFNLVRPFRLKGLHLNKRNPVRPPIETTSVSRSCHSLECLEASMNNHDYLFLSPLFDSISKAGYGSAFTKEQLLAAKSRQVINERAIALGGINETTILLADQYGFGGVAVLGAIWRNYLQDNDADALLERFNRLHTITNQL